MRIRRPLGLTVVALILGWLGVAGVLNTFVWYPARAAIRADTPAHLRMMVDAIASPAVSLGAALYAITALVSAVGVWRLRPWAHLAIFAWGASIVILCSLLTRVGTSIDVAVDWRVLGFSLAVLVIVVVAIGSYVLRES